MTLDRLLHSVSSSVRWSKWYQTHEVFVKILKDNTWHMLRNVGSFLPRHCSHLFIFHFLPIIISCKLNLSSTLKSDTWVFVLFVPCFLSSLLSVINILLRYSKCSLYVQTLPLGMHTVATSCFLGSITFFLLAFSHYKIEMGSLKKYKGYHQQEQGEKKYNSITQRQML